MRYDKDPAKTTAVLKDAIINARDARQPLVIHVYADGLKEAEILELADAIANLGWSLEADKLQVLCRVNPEAMD